MTGASQTEKRYAEAAGQSTGDWFYSTNTKMEECCLSVDRNRELVEKMTASRVEKIPLSNESN
jgi:hypothetical protein